MKIAIYKNTDKESDYFGKVSKVQIVPEDKSDKEMQEMVNKFNSSQNKSVVTLENVPDTLCEPIEFLIENRNININYHLNKLEDIKNSIGDIHEYLLNR